MHICRSENQENKPRFFELVNGTKFSVKNVKTSRWEHFEYQDYELLELKEKMFIQDGIKYTILVRTGMVFAPEHVNNIAKE